MALVVGHNGMGLQVCNENRQPPLTFVGSSSTNYSTTYNVMTLTLSSFPELVSLLAPFLALICGCP
jgi:hypothetical protein